MQISDLSPAARNQLFSAIETANPSFLGGIISKIPSPKSLLSPAEEAGFIRKHGAKAYNKAAEAAESIKNTFVSTTGTVGGGLKSVFY